MSHDHARKPALSAAIATRDMNLELPAAMGLCRLSVPVAKPPTHAKQPEGCTEAAKLKDTLQASAGLCQVLRCCAVGTGWVGENSIGLEDAFDKFGMA